ncbi:MAG: preprotein translocase subunit SecA [Pirellulaceae bacterium]
MFDLFFGGKKRANVEVISDYIWMTTEAKFAGLTKEAVERSKSDTVAILLVAHFPDVQARLERIAEQTKWDVPVKAVPASNLNAHLARSLSLDESGVIDVIVAERHPLPSIDDQLEEFADNLPCRCRFSHHLSLDDAAFRVFAGDWVQQVMRQLGMKEDEAIQSQMVSRRIRKAQEKIEGRGVGSREAGSAAEWLEQNCPDVGRN